MSRTLRLGRYDFAGYAAFTAYALCSLVIPLVIVAMGRDLAFPLDRGGMEAGGSLHMLRSVAIVAALLSCSWVAGRIGKRRSMGICMLLTGGGILLCALAPAYWWLIPSLAIAGLGEGICKGIATPFVQDLHNDAPERYINIAHSFWSVGIGLCVFIAGGLLTLGVSWRIIMGLCGGLALLASLGFLWKENPAHKYPESAEKINFNTVLRHTAAIIKVPRFWVYCFGMFTGAGAEFCLTFWAAAYLQLHFHTGAWVAGLGTGAIALGMFTSRLGFGFIAKKKYLRHILLGSGIWTIPVTVALAVLTPEMFSGFWSMAAVLLFLLFLGGIGIGPYWPTLQVYGVDHLPELDSTMLYIYFSAMGIPGCGFFTWFMGVLGDRFGLAGAFYMLPATLIVFSIIVYLEAWVWPRRKGK